MELCHSCHDIIRYCDDETVHSTCPSFLAAVDQGCYVCQGIFRQAQAPEEWKQCPSRNNILRYGDDEEYNSTFRLFLAAVDQGCYICQGLFRQAPEEWKQEIRKRVEESESSPKTRRKVDDSQRRLKLHRRTFRNSRYAHIWLNPKVIGLNVDYSSHEIELPRAPVQIVYPVAAESIPWIYTSLSTNSEETFTKIKIWLGRCKMTHEKCRFRRDEADLGWHPTRLIEIALESEKIESPDDLNCRVVEPKSENMPQNPRYITLSHRWPQDQQGFQKLTVDKLPLWKASLPAKILRKTFRDALFVAQRLGISYVWIDSLCIIQDGDDYADWRKEAPLMQKVYSNAEFNLCASKNEQDEGLFSTRNPSPRQPPRFELPCLEDDDGADCRNGVEDHDSGHYLIRMEEPFDIWDAKTNDSPLASRGWVFQEQLLSRVNIHFGKHEVFFECPEMRASESLGSDQDYEVSWKSLHTFIESHLPIPTVIEGGRVSPDERNVSDSDYGEDFHAIGRWHLLLGNYTTLRLTNSDDRLVALSGVAQYFRKFFSYDDCYIAGLWRSHLDTEMLWRLRDATSKENWEERKARRRHLTFSWASVEGTVESHLGWYHDEHLADLEPIKYRTSSEAIDATGVEGQPFTDDIYSLPSQPTIEIRITGFLRQMKVERDEARWYKNSNLMLYRWTRNRSYAIKGETSLDFEISSSELAVLNRSERLFMMPLIRGQETFVGLLLLELVEDSDGKDMGRFRRIGVHFLNRDGPMGEWFVECIFFENSLSKLPCWRYDYRSKKHTIFII